MTTHRHDAEDLDTLARAVGFVVLQWGQAEQSLDLLVALLWHSFEGKKHAKKIPVLLTPKIGFVRACFATDDRLAPYKADSQVLLDEFERLSGIRHDLIHGAVASIAPVDNAIVFAKLDVKGDYHVHREVRISAQQYPKLVDDLLRLGQKAQELSERVFESLGPM